MVRVTPPKFKLPLIVLAVPVTPKFPPRITLPAPRRIQNRCSSRTQIERAIICLIAGGGVDRHRTNIDRFARDRQSICSERKRCIQIYDIGLTTTINGDCTRKAGHSWQQRNRIIASTTIHGKRGNTSQRNRVVFMLAIYAINEQITRHNAQFSYVVCSIVGIRQIHYKISDRGACDINWFQSCVVDDASIELNITIRTVWCDFDYVRK